MTAERSEPEVGDRVGRISKPGRVGFSERGETKLDLARYYLLMSHGIVNRDVAELCVTHPADVVWAVQLSTVEFHPWNSRPLSLVDPRREAASTGGDGV